MKGKIKVVFITLVCCVCVFFLYQLKKVILINKQEEKTDVILSEKQKKYIPPETWNRYIISNDFSISIPSSMEIRKKDDFYSERIKKINWNGYKVNLNHIVFQQKDLSSFADEASKTYSRVIIFLDKGKAGDFFKKTERPVLFSLEEKRAYEEMINSTKYKIVGSIRVKNIKIENFYGILIEYTRTGEEGMYTCVSTYFFSNNDKSATITLSYRLEDSEKWENDFSKIIRTFKWEDYNFKKHKT